MQVRQFHGKGTGGLTRISSLPKALQQKFSRMLELKHGLVKKKRDLQDENSEAKVPQKKKRVYGVQMDRYYVNKSEKHS